MCSTTFLYQHNAQIENLFFLSLTLIYLSACCAEQHSLCFYRQTGRHGTSPVSCTVSGLCSPQQAAVYLNLSAPPETLTEPERKTHPHKNNWNKHNPDYILFISTYWNTFSSALSLILSISSQGFLNIWCLWPGNTIRQNTHFRKVRLLLVIKSQSTWSKTETSRDSVYSRHLYLSSADHQWTSLHLM